MEKHWNNESLTETLDDITPHIDTFISTDTVRTTRTQQNQQQTHRSAQYSYFIYYIYFLLHYTDYISNKLLCRLQTASEPKQNVLIYLTL